MSSSPLSSCSRSTPSLFGACHLSQSPAGARLSPQQDGQVTPNSPTTPRLGSGSAPSPNATPAEPPCPGERKNFGIQCEPDQQTAFYTEQHKEPYLNILKSLESFPPLPPLHPVADDIMKQYLLKHEHLAKNDAEAENLLREFKTSQPTLLPLVRLYFCIIDWLIHSIHYV